MSDYQSMKRSKIYTLSAAKGIACSIVAANHYFNLYPVSLPVPLLYFKKWFSNGSYMVYLFLAISYFLASLKYYQTEHMNIGRESLIRYLRLVLPIIILYTIVYFLHRLGLFNKLEYALAISGGGDKAIDYSKIPPPGVMYKTALFRTLIKSTADFVFPLWMIYAVFIGNIVTWLFCGIYVSLKNLKSRVSVSILFILLVQQIDFFYVLCVLASCLAYACCQDIKMPRMLTIFCILFGIAAGFHRGRTSLDKWIYVVGSTALLFACIHSQILNTLCRCRLPLILEKLSFPIYLIHQPVTTSFCAYLYLYLNTTSLNIGLQNAVLFLAYLFLIILLAIIWLKAVQPLIEKSISFLVRVLVQEQLLQRKNGIRAG